MPLLPRPWSAVPSPVRGGAAGFAPHAAGRFTGPRVALGVLIAASFVVRLAWGAALEPTNDEAYHFLYTVHPDLSYFDHPPMTMWVAKLGLLLCGGWVHPVSLRLGFTLMFAGSTWVLARFTARWYGDRAGLYAALLLNVTAYYTAAGGFALPDAPFLFFGLLTIAALGGAVVADPGRTRPWVWVGLAFAGALLSKYHAIFLPAGAVLYILLTPGTRGLLLRPGPYLAVGMGAVGFIPVLVWNAEHGWASFVFQGGRAVGGSFRPVGLAASLLGPIGYLTPWVWAVLVSVLAGRLRRFRSLAGIDRLLVCAALVPLTFFVSVSAVRWVFPHWLMIGFVPLYPMAGAKCAGWVAAHPVWGRRAVAYFCGLTLVMAGLVLAQARYGVVTFPGKDPCADMSGWESVSAELEAKGLVGRPNTFLFTSRWFDSGQLAFATRNRAPVACYNAGDARGFAFWSRPDDWVGKDGVLVQAGGPEYPEWMYAAFFEKMELVAEFRMDRGGSPFRPVKVYLCSGQKTAFPFAYPVR